MSDSPNLIRKRDNANIPPDTTNSDYKEYLELCGIHGQEEITENQ